MSKTPRRVLDLYAMGISPEDIAGVLCCDLSLVRQTISQATAKNLQLYERHKEAKDDRHADRTDAQRPDL